MRKKAYKLLKLRKNGTVGPLFINRRQIIRLNVWLDAENHPTKGYVVRPGWHVTLKPEAPHLSMRSRIWMKVEVEDYKEFKRPESQGVLWLLANRMIVLGKIFKEEKI